MAIDAYMVFQDYNGKFLASESTVAFAKQPDELGRPITEAGAGNVFEIEDYSFGVEQTLNIGSQSTGAGAGKIMFNPFAITRKIDKSSPIFFENACSGKSFAKVHLGFRKSAGADSSGLFFLLYTFKLVAVKTINWSHDDEAARETITFEYGAMQMRYAPQNPNGSMGTVIPGGWSRVTNTQDLTATNIGASK